MSPRESALAERERKDAEKAAANLERQVRQGIVSGNTSDSEVKDEASTSEPKRRSSRPRSKSK